MPGAQPKEVTDQVKELLDAGFEADAVRKRLKIGRSSIYRIMRNYREYGTPYKPKAEKTGRPRLLAYEQELEASRWLLENQNKFLDDMIWYIHSRFGLVISTTTASKMRQRWNVTGNTAKKPKPEDVHPPRVQQRLQQQGGEAAPPS